MQKKYGKKNTKVLKTKNGRIMLLSKFAVCDSKKSLGIRTPLGKIRLVRPLLGC